MPYRLLVSGSAFLALAGLVTGCSGAPDSQDGALATASDPISGGYSDSADTSTFGVVNISVGSLCSGSLIAPNVVLTARHCVAPVLDETNGSVNCATTQFGANYAADTFYVSSKAVLDMTPSSYHAVTQVTTPPESAHLCGYDQAILFLSESIDPSEAVPRNPRVDSPVAKGDEYYAIGYGGTDNNGTGAGQRRRRDDLHVMCVDKCPSDEVTPNELIGDTGICEGDSGGPAVDMQGRVIGVTSRGGAGCTNPIYGSVYAWAEWIKDTTAAGAKLGGYAPPPWTMGAPTDPEYTDPVGGVCTQGSDCASGYCAGDSSGLYCTRLCDKAACPDGYQCDTNSNPAVCTKIPPAMPASTSTPNAKADTSSSTPSQTSSCSFVVPVADPTKPIPWFAAVAGIAAIAVRRRRRG